MHNRVIKLIGILSFMGSFLIYNPVTASAQEFKLEKAATHTSTYLVVKIHSSNIKVRKSYSEKSEPIGRVEQGKVYEVLDDAGNGWVRVNTGTLEGYINIADKATIVEKTRVMADPNMVLREKIVNYALQLVGGPYRYGGNDPRTGVDCSGFTKYVMKNAADITLNRSSSSQAAQGSGISKEQAKPGDLIFYGGNGFINHVAVYMGDEKIVHASSAKTGIKVSRWDHRKQVKIINVIGD